MFRLMYAARDVTSTVGCIGLIVSSIISKKVAEGIKHLVLDIKWGQGCYQDSQERAESLAQVLVETSRNVGVNTVAVISHMESPLGRCVGNSLEVEESLECLRGEASGGSRDLRDLVVTQGAMLLTSAGQVDNLDLGKQRIREVLDNGEAMKKFHDMIIRQVNNQNNFDNYLMISRSTRVWRSHWQPRCVTWIRVTTTE